MTLLSIPITKFTIKMLEAVPIRLTWISIKLQQKIILVWAENGTFYI